MISAARNSSWERSKSWILAIGMKWGDGEEFLALLISWLAGNNV
jgi:hypothetical protein